MTDMAKIRLWREKIREVIGFKDGNAITDEMLSAPMAVLCEVWAMRIYCSLEKHTKLEPAELMQRISADLSRVMQNEAVDWLPHAKTFSYFVDRSKEKGG